MKRGQITMFVILGLVVLLVVGLLLLLKTPDRKPTSLQASQDSDQVTQMLQSCLNQVGEDVLRDIGSNGGYIDTSAFKETNSIRDSQVIEFPPQKVVLWHEIHPCPENAAGCVANNRPPLCKAGESCPVTTAPDTNPKAPSIQEQLEKTIAQRIDACIDRNTFPDITIKKTGTPVVHATIRDDDIALAMDYPMTITTADKQTVDMTTSYTTLQIALPRLYKFAADIQSAESQQSFLEQAFLHLLSIYSGVDTDIPPMRDISLFGPKSYWVRTTVQQHIEQDILPFMNFIQVINAQDSFTPILTNESDQYAPYANGVYEFLVMKLDNNTVPYGARFEYPNTQMFLDINGKELLKPQELGGGGFLAKLTGMFFTQYKFKYSAAFPVIVHLNDPAAFNGKGYSLDFGLEANIRNNYPLNATEQTVTLSSPLTTLDLSDPQQLVNHMYNVKVSDEHLHQPLAGASVQYECGQRFYLGETGDDGAWTGKMPYCLSGGVVTVEKFGYMGIGKEMNTAGDENGATTNVDIEVWPRHEKLVKIYKRTVTDVDGLSKGGSSTQYRTPLGANDSVLLQITRHTDNSYDEDVPLGGIVTFGNSGTKSPADMKKELDDAFNSGQSGMTQDQYNEAVSSLQDLGTPAPSDFVEEKLVDFVPGDYDTNMILTYNGLIQIPEMKKSTGGILSKSYTLPAQNFTTWVSGGAVLSANDVHLDENTVYNDQNITFYVLEEKIPQIWDDINSFQSIEDYQAYKKTMMKLEFS